MARVRVLVVDDEPDIRALITAVLQYDGRYVVVGEAVDGADAVEQAIALQPDVVVLDKSMPRMTGLDALPRLREAAPAATVVLYTAESDAQVHQAAVAGGAADVLTKDGHVTELAGLLADALLRSWEERSDLFVRVGPVPSDAVLEWIGNTRRIFEVVRDDPGLTDQPLDPDVLDTFCAYLDSWQEVAEASPEFVWAASAAEADVEGLLGAWTAIDRIDEDRLRAHGVEWSGPRARVFFDALTEGVIGAIERRDARSSLAAELRRQFGS